MSAISAALVTFGGAVEDVLLRIPNRGIAGIVLPSCIVTEAAEDEMTITEHPVETGANITDHAFKQPAKLSLTYGWSVSGGNIPGIGTLGLGFLTGASSPSDIYASLLALQTTRQPFNVITGKRRYQNMLLKRISKTTDAETENCLMVDMDLQEVLLVGTTTTATTGNPASQAANGGTVNNGSQQPVDVTGDNTDQQLINAGVANATINTTP